MIKEKLLETKYFIDNEYLDSYAKLIENNLDRKSEKYKTQKHHIIPRSYYALIGYNYSEHRTIINSKSNLVNLLYKDHVLAHYYLSLCVNDPELKYKNMYAFCRMTKENPFNYDITDVEKLEKFQEIQENYQKENSARTTKRLIGHKTSQETKDKIGKANKERYSRVKHVCVHIDTLNKVVPITELDSYISQGWTLGMNDPERFKKISLAEKSNPKRTMLGKKQSEHQKEVVRKLRTGAVASEETRKNMSKAHSNKILISNIETKQSFYVSREEFENHYKYLNFYQGRLKRD